MMKKRKTQIISYIEKDFGLSDLRRDNNSHQFVTVSTNIECCVFDGSDIGGDDHVGASATRRAAAVLDNWGCTSRSLRWCERAVDYGGGSRKSCRR